MRLVWSTDPHLNHVPLAVWEQWIAEIRGIGADGLLVTGDISEGDDVVFELRRLAESLAQPVYFVLGNHDFYQSSIALTRQRVIELCREHPLLCYLTDAQPIEIASKTYIVGDDGWGDATHGDYLGSPVRLNDFQLIADFRSANPSRWAEMLHHEGQSSAARLANKLLSIPRDAAHVLVITHVPPFREACWYEGRTTDDWWAPFFVCGELGAVLEKTAESNPQTQFTTLCGHTHHAGIAQMAANHCVYTGAAVYGSPRVEGIISSHGGELGVELTHRE